MDLSAAQKMATDLMSEHDLTGVGGWSFGFDNAKRRLGACHFSKRTITLSQAITVLNDEAVIRETVLHEIAHALVGARHGHDHVWRQKAISIGSNGKRCSGADDHESPESPWVGTCSKGHTCNRHKSPTRLLGCGKCSKRFSSENLYTWAYHGTPVPLDQMPRAYQTSYATYMNTASPTTPAIRAVMAQAPAASEPTVGDSVRWIGSGAPVTGVVKKVNRVNLQVAVQTPSGEKVFNGPKRGWATV